MSFFDDMMADDAARACAADAPGAEAVVYTKAGKKPSVDGIPLNCHVFRIGPRSMPGGDGMAAATLEAFVPAGQGITRVDTGGDSITVKRTAGAVAETFPIREILSEDAGGWHVKLY